MNEAEASRPALEALPTLVWCYPTLDAKPADCTCGVGELPGVAATPGLHLEQATTIPAPPSSPNGATHAQGNALGPRMPPL